MNKEYIKNLPDCCLKCHFLEKEHINETVNLLERQELFNWIKAEDDNRAQLSVYSPKCRKGVWKFPKSREENLKLKISEEVAGEQKDTYKNMLTCLRDECFFYEYKPKLSWVAAEELERRKKDREALVKTIEQAKIANKSARNATFIAIAAIVVAAIVNFICHFFPIST